MEKQQTQVEKISPKMIAKFVVSYDKICTEAKEMLDSDTSPEFVNMAESLLATKEVMWTWLKKNNVPTDVMKQAQMGADF